MNSLKKGLGIVWMVLGIAIIFAIIYAGYFDVSNAKPEQLMEKKVSWIIMATVFAPVSLGLSLFGYYALSGDYDTGTVDNTPLV